jgi:hypothetical protein
MEWVALVLVVGLGLFLVVYVIIGIKGVRSIKQDGWAPIEAVFGKRFLHLDKDRQDDE